jgi:hypothetical protein
MLRLNLRFNPPNGGYALKKEGIGDGELPPCRAPYPPIYPGKTPYRPYLV